MKAKVFFFITLVACAQPPARAMTVHAAMFEHIVRDAKLIVSALVLEGRIDDRTRMKEEVGTNTQPIRRYCARVDEIIFGSFEMKEVCFQSRSGLKVGSDYLLFLVMDSNVITQKNPNGYLDSLALEIEEVNPFHAYRALRWEPFRHPMIPGLMERTASIEYKDEQDATVSRGMVLYSYFPLQDVERTIRGIIRR